MKKYVYVIIITILLFSVVIWEQVFVDNSLNGLISQVDSIDEVISASWSIDSTEIKDRIDTIDTFWTEKEKILCLVINHNDLSRIGEQIKKIKVYINQNDKENCEYELETLKFYAENYKHVMELNIQNLL